MPYICVRLFLSSVSSGTTVFIFFFFFNDTATPEIYTLSLHDALPICADAHDDDLRHLRRAHRHRPAVQDVGDRSEEHTSELQSLTNLVCRLLLEKKKKKRQKSSTQQRLRSGDRIYLITKYVQPRRQTV